MKQILAFLWALCLGYIVHAQPDTAVTKLKIRYGNGLRISLLTCGPGTEIWETFGHTAVRIVDSNAQVPFNDLVYNYGMFSFGPGFELQFMRGKLDYFVASGYYGNFLEEYYEYGRSVHEQQLMLSDDKKMEIKAFLENNALPQNRYYKYDFFFDNCATRIRDVFPKSLGKGFQFANALKGEPQLTFRDIMNRYFYRRHWDRIGVNILLGSKIDKVMTNEDIMFLPDYLEKGIAGATLDGKPLSTHSDVILEGSPHLPAGLNAPMLLTCSFFLLVLLGTTVARIRWLGNFMSKFILFITGLLGCIILVMWLGTDHQGCSNNFNIFWALPVNLLLTFWKPKGRSKYAIIALALLAVPLLLHVLHVQALIPEFLPLFAALVVVYIRMYKNASARQA